MCWDHMESDPCVVYTTTHAPFHLLHDHDGEGFEKEFEKHGIRCFFLIITNQSCTMLYD
jgi:hypothetical protein